MVENGGFFIEENQTNENEMDIEKDVERRESENVQTNNEEKYAKIHVQRKFWRGHNRNSLCWAFYFVNDGKEVEVNPVKSWDVFYVMIMQKIFIMQKINK